MLCGTLTGRWPMGRYDILRRIERLDARIRRGWPEATRAGAAFLPTAPAAALLHAATPANVSQRLCHRGAANGDYRLATKLMPRMALHTTMRPTRPPRSYTRQRQRMYPNGYAIEELRTETTGSRRN